MHERNEALILASCIELKMTREELTEHVKKIAPYGLSNAALSKIRRILHANPKIVKAQEAEEFVNSFLRKFKINKTQLKQRLNTFSPTISADDHIKLRGILGIEANKSLIKLKQRTPEQIEYEKTIIKLWKDGKTYWEIAEATGHTFGGTIQKINRLRMRGVPLQKRNPFGLKNPPGYNAHDVGKRLREGERLNAIATSFNKTTDQMSTIVCIWRKKHPDAKIPYLKKKS